MIRYVVMIEYQVCSADERCKYFFQCDHPKKLEWEPSSTLCVKVGPCNAMVNSIAERPSTHNGQTGQAYVAVVDTSSFKQLLTDDEQAAYRLGGPKAVTKLKKAKARAAKTAAAGQALIKQVRAEEAALRAKHTCVKSMSSMSCHACNTGVPYPHPSVDELLGK